MADYAAGGSMPNLDVLWQDDPQSWTDLNQQATVITQLKELMGNRTDWRLVLDFDPSLSKVVASGAAWNESNLVRFINSLKAAGLTPEQIVYHPDATSALYWLVNETDSSSGTLASLGPPFDIDVQSAVAKSIANWMATLNTALQKSGLPQNYQLNAVIGEGTYLPKDAEHFAAFRDYLTKAGISPNVPIWYTGDWHQGTTISDTTITTSPVQGVYVQLYDYYPEKGEANPLEPFGPDGQTVIKNPTDPKYASTIGAQLLTSLSTVGGGSHLNSDLLQNPNNAVFTLNFTGILNDAPVFGPLGSGGVTGNWNLDSTNALLLALKNEAIREMPLEQTTPPDIAIWGIEKALDILVPHPSANPTVFAVPDAGGENDFQAAIVRSPLLFVSDDSGSLTANLKLQNAALSGIGLFPVLDQQGHLRASDGHLVSPNDPGYGLLAQKLALNNGVWLENLGQSYSDAVPISIKPDWAVTQRLSYALVAQESNGQFHTSLDPNSSSNPWLAQGIGADFGSYGVELNGWSATKGADFNEAVIKLDGLIPFTAEKASTHLPAIDVLWLDGPAWDKGTADQIAQLIAYSPDGAVYPNQDLNLIVSVIGPNNTSLNATSAAHKGLNFANVPNNAAGLISFIQEINSELSTLTGGRVTWTGNLGYHPDTTKTDFADWAGWAGQVSSSGASFQLSSDLASSYQAYVDYGLYLNASLQDHGLKGFSQLVFETEGSYYHDKNASPSLEQQLFTSLLPNYAGNPALLNGKASWSNTMSATASSAPITNWNKSTLGWGATNYLAQMYDLAQDPTDYQYTNWPVNFAQLNPDLVTVEAAAQTFANFSANSSLSKPILAEYNINRVISGQADMTTPSTAYNPNATIVFSYGPGVYQNHPDPNDPSKMLPPDPNANQPIFQYGVYDTINAPVTTPVYSWSGDAFAAFVDRGSPTAFPQLLTNNLRQIATQFGVTSSFTNTQDLKLGVWGGERALDAWVGLPAYQNPIDFSAPVSQKLIPNSTTNIKSWFNSQPTKSGAPLDLYAFYLADTDPYTGHLHINNGYILQNNVWSVFSGDVPQQTIVVVIAADFNQLTYTAPNTIGQGDNLYACASANGQWSSIAHTLINT